MITQPAILDALRAHSRAAYPEECCGFLLGHATADGNHVITIRPVENRDTENRKRHYTMTPADYVAAERAAQRQGFDIVGFYHSHPDHPARPSATDLAEATFPGYTYVIVSVENGEPGPMTAWSLAPDRSHFDPEAITLETSREPIHP